MEHFERVRDHGMAMYGAIALLGNNNALADPGSLAEFDKSMTIDCGDIRVKPIMSTQRNVPWQSQLSWCLADTEAETTWSLLSSRTCLARVVEEYQQYHLTAVAAFEREFYLLLRDGQDGVPYGLDRPSTVYSVGHHLDEFAR
jgi:glutamine synthetase